METILFNTHDLALLVTMYECILFAFCLLLLKKGKKQSNVLLALFLLSYAAIPLDTLINFGAAFRQFSINFSPNIFYLFGNAYWLESVFLLFYVRSLIYKNYQFKWQHGFYFVPFLLYSMYEYMHWYSLTESTKLAILDGYKLSNEPSFVFYINLFRECFRTFCGVLCLVELRRYQKQIRNELADIESVDLTWLKVLVLGFLLVRIDAIIVTLGYIISIQFGFEVNYKMLGLMSNWTVLLLISFLIFFSIGFSNIFQGISSLKEKESEKQPISMETVKLIQQYMLESKPYLNHLLTIDNLANQLNIAPRTLSQIINRHFLQNFFEFINQYRIDESKILLVSEEHRKSTMLEVMDLAGFNSKATFNTFFKKIVGLTPTQYRKQQLQS